ncbi:four helix bundle protein [Flectobacillus sp. DC10W]|uniref:Four helix bundle protein n=1 Tax=Flectobacillus longus TaxID=2984207 RepID=A0ABT6YJM7_9BACT|nr:four helix bundle protein [Flectobacillus longus]MDI9863791.1 four helix bundle protein [Flectobacillus longus]
MTQIKSFRDLLVWQKSMSLVTSIYQLTRDFPHSEMFGLTSQLRRASISIPSNIAEGYGRNTSKDYLRYLQIALGSLYEIQTQLEIASNLHFLEIFDFNKMISLCLEIERMLTSLIAKIRAKIA